MIDSHCHLDHEPLFDQIESVLERSKKIGLKKLLTICTTFDSFDKILKIITIDSIIYGTFGIHPHETNKNNVSVSDIIKNVRRDKKIIGVGETGLDFFYNHSDKDIQIKSFKNHIEASIELNLPLIVHSRSAEKETFEILNQYKEKSPKILMHCFTGSLEFANKLMDLNSYFSASGIITFKNSTELQNTFKQIPFNRLLIETDSPYLAPIPMRGKKNEPSFIKFTAEKLASIKDIDFDQIEKLTTNNFNSLFHSNVS
ncbi:TatD family hydrolase [Candidatus Pelagibacter sp.]|nr:TatD family hydrolase [Candidatus Pelagibacter sp.]